MKNFTKLIGLIAIVAMVGFGMVACDNGGGNGGDSTAKKITVTGITGSYDAAMVQIFNENDYAGGMGSITNGSVTVDLMTSDDEDTYDVSPFTGSGSFYVMLMVGNMSDESEGAMYIYTNGQSVDMSTQEKAMQNLPKLNISGANTSVAFTKFKTAPEWMTENGD